MTVVADSYIIWSEVTLGICDNLALMSFITVNGTVITVLIFLMIVARSLDAAAILIMFCAWGPCILFMIATNTLCRASGELSDSYNACSISSTARFQRWKSMLSLSTGRLVFTIPYIVLRLLTLSCFWMYSFLICSCFWASNSSCKLSMTSCQFPLVSELIPPSLTVLLCLTSILCACIQSLEYGYSSQYPLLPVSCPPVSGISFSMSSQVVHNIRYS